MNESIKNPRDVFLDQVNEELIAMEHTGRISPKQAEEKRKAAAIIEISFSDDPKHDALLFSRAGIAGEEETLGMLKKRSQEKS